MGESGARRLRKGDWRAVHAIEDGDVVVIQVATANIQPRYLSEIETAKTPGSVAVYQALANALNVKIDDLPG